MRLNILFFSCLIILCVSGCKSPAEQAEQSVKLVQNFKPNIIFIFADDLGWGDLSCYGNSRVKTPSLDRLASEGTLFTQFYVAGSVCSPSRAGIMTGQYPARNRVFGHFASTAINQRRGMPNALDPDLVMLTDMLKGAGYTTAHFGKWHLGNISPAEYGVDVYRTNELSNMGDDPLDIWSAEARPTCTKDILDETLKFIKQEGNPFYVNVWLSDVHATLNPSKEQMDRVADEVKNWRWPSDGIEYTSVEQVYLATLLEMDRQIGLFIDKLEALGIRNNSLIIFSSDNGPEDYQLHNSRHSGVGSPGPFRGRKRSIYEGGIRVPFIISWPGKIPAGKVNDQSVVSGVDFLPTLACITGAKAANERALDGEDMSEVWLGSDRKRSKDLFWEWRYQVFGHSVNKPPMIAVREGDYKLLLNPDKSRVELYNILTDPGELNNLASQEPELAMRLSEKAMTWFQNLPESPWDETAGQNAWNWP
ncbi:MAG: sulfatase-like hydrolase/transferase [Bacteroides sp.]|nr:sulfatase-like hydrolase/transferase [Bacteroides sp.]